MSVKTYIISLSLAGAAAALGCWMFMGAPKAEAQSTGRTKNVSAKIARQVEKAPSTREQRKPKNKTAAPTGSPIAGAAARNALAPPAVEPATPEAKAARVEQEANHELRRLVTLLNLDEAQQDKVFQSLVQNSRYWTPDMQVAVPGAASTGKRSHLTEGSFGGVFIPITEAPATTVPDKTAATAPADSTTPPSDTITSIVGTSPNAGDNAKINDPMSEIMSLLTPEQQLALIEAETDRTAWWAEILPEILPTEDVPAIDGSTEDTKNYEGSETLE